MSDLPDWFSAYAKPNFERFLIPLAGQDNLTLLQLGAYTGDASIWIINNLGLLNLFDVDTWKGSDEDAHKKMDFSEVERVYDEKVQGRAHKKKMTTVDYLLNNRLYQYDFIYIDADHTTVGVLFDAELSWPLLKSGGLLAFDDYQWGQHLPVFKTPKLGIDLFLERHLGEYEILEQGLQVWLRKL